MAYFRCTTGGSGKGNTLVVTCADDLAGATITCTNGTKTYRKTCPSTAPYEVTFYGLEAGTWTVSATVSGNTYTTTVVITDYEAELGGFSWRRWVDTASQLDSTDYASLSEVLADEEAVRELCLEHACVDYMAEVTSTNEELETVINNDLFAKWVNNSDYSLDVLGANVVIKALMDEADKYGYGEWCLMPQVPKMTSNTAPYGEASATSTLSGGSYPAWKAFVNDLTGASAWVSASGSITNQRLSYCAPNAISVSRISLFEGTTNTSEDVKKFKIQYSTNGSDWQDASVEYTYNESGDRIQYFDTNTDVSARYWGVLCINNNGSSSVVKICNLQFYAWQPKGNVPVMTSDTAPYGQCLKSGAYTNYEAFRAFARRLNDVVDSATDSNHAAWAVNGTTGYIGYEFTNPVEVTQIAYVPRYFNTECSKQSPGSWNLEYSNDNSQWNIAQSYTEEITTQKEIRYRKLDTSFGYHRYWRMNITANLGSANFAGICALQFYGRELKASVPKMSSATPPFGSLIYNIDPQNDNRPWYAFDNSATTAAMTKEANQVPFRIGYDFEKLVRVAYLAYIPLKSSESASLTNHTDTFYYSLDGITWNVLATNEVTNANAKQINLVSFDPIVCKAIKYETSTPTMSNGYSSLCELLVFGEDYSEKEFEEGTNKKWLYDHGVELESLDKYKGELTTSSLPITDNEEMYLPTLTATQGSWKTFTVVGKTIDLTNYSRIRLKFGDRFNPSSGETGSMKLFSTSAIPSNGEYSDSNVIGGRNLEVPSSEPNMFALDVSSISQSVWVSVGNYWTIGKASSFAELWLE